MLSLIAALSFVSIACLGLIVMQIALPFDLGPGDLLFGIAVLAVSGSH
jgi:hypothetical protein